MIATLTLDVPTLQLIVTITIHVLLIIAIQTLDATTIAMNAHIKMLAIL